MLYSCSFSNTHHIVPSLHRASDAYEQSKVCQLVNSPQWLVLARRTYERSRWPKPARHSICWSDWLRALMCHCMSWSNLMMLVKGATQATPSVFTLKLPKTLHNCRIGCLRGRPRGRFGGSGDTGCGRNTSCLSWSRVRWPAQPGLLTSHLSYESMPRRGRDTNSTAIMKHLGEHNP